MIKFDFTDKVVLITASSKGIGFGIAKAFYDNGAKVNIENCSINENSGASELKTYWQDPDFLMEQRAFYYVRVLENPVCRWSTWDAVKAGVQPRPDLKKTLQERAWTSPIWVMPQES
jgi:hypothetical protein